MATLMDPAEVRTIAVIGAGAIGASWASLALTQGYAVVASDPVDGAHDRDHPGMVVGYVVGERVEHGFREFVGRAFLPPIAEQTDVLLDSETGAELALELPIVLPSLRGVAHGSPWRAGQKILTK